VILLANRRVDLAPVPVRRGTPAREAVVAGHCPGPHVASALSAAAVDALGAAGLSALAALLRRLAAGAVVLPVDDEDLAARLAGDGDLTHLPLVFTSLAAFSAVFPQASSAAPVEGRPLCGAGSWLARAVADFFQAGGEQCWVIAVGEGEGVAGFLPADPASVQGRLSEPERLRGLELLTVIPEAGLLAVPDLERLLIPPDLADPFADDPPSPEPEFLPCRGAPAPVARAVAAAPPVPGPGGAEALRAIAGFLAVFRPDVQWLHTLPMTSRQRTATGVAPPAGDGTVPGLDAVGRAALALLAADARTARVLQPLWPYLRDPGGALSSASGLLAGMIAASARALGPWRSIAGTALPTLARPFPVVDVLAAAELRESDQVGVLVVTGGRLELDDERSPSADLAYSSEVARFLGWLRRRLERLGERLVFTADPRDPAVGLVVEEELERLLQRGALTSGGPGAPAFRVQVVPAEEGQLIIELELRPALPIDLVRLALIGRDGRFALEQRHGA
jgi:hypothetical protein